MTLVARRSLPVILTVAIVVLAPFFAVYQSKLVLNVSSSSHSIEQALIVYLYLKNGSSMTSMTQEIGQQYVAIARNNDTFISAKYEEMSAVDILQQPYRWPRQRLSAGVPTLTEAERLSAVEYDACCGLGHRLIRTAAASYASKLANMSLRIHWGYCNGVEVFSHLFGPQPLDEMIHVTDIDRYLFLGNEVPGSRHFYRDPSAECKCHFEKFRHDANFFLRLADRFRGKRRVDESRSKLFKGKTIGIHIRAGNGEAGDFAKKGRGIANLSLWLENVAQLIRKQDWGASTIFIATDTPQVVADFKTFFQGTSTDIVMLDQYRPPNGEGVLFGEAGKVESNGDQCMRGWEDALTDMFLLGQVDVLIASRPSSFTISIPMHLVLHPSTTNKQFCELDYNATAMQCFQSFNQWCCSGSTEFTLATGARKREYLLTFDDELYMKRFGKKALRVRPDGGCPEQPAGRNGFKRFASPCFLYDFRLQTRRTSS